MTASHPVRHDRAHCGYDIGHYEGRLAAADGCTIWDCPYPFSGEVPGMSADERLRRRAGWVAGFNEQRRLHP